MSKLAAKLVIRKRERLQASPAQGLDQTWTEYQVLQGRKVIARFGTLDEAEKFWRTRR